MFKIRRITFVTLNVLAFLLVFFLFFGIIFYLCAIDDIINHLGLSYIIIIPLAILGLVPIILLIAQVSNWVIKPYNDYLEEQEKEKIRQENLKKIQEQLKIEEAQYIAYCEQRKKGYSDYVNGKRKML